MAPLNPHAKSWFPDAKKPTEIFTQPQEFLPPYSCDDAIYGGVPPSPVCDPFPQAQPLQLYQYVPFPVHFNYRFYTPEHLFHEQQGYQGFLNENSNYNKYHKLVEDKNYSKSFQEISCIIRKPKFLRNKFVPPRLRGRWFIHGFQEKKSLPKKVWKPKKEEIINTDHSSSEEEESPDCKKTTVMLKNVPNQYRRDSLMEFLDRKCSELDIAYDFLYLPMDFIKKDNLGFAFVNFTTASAAMKIKATLQDFKWGEFSIPTGRFSSKKILEITWAKIQGKEALIKHFNNSRFTCDNQEFLPVVISPARNGISSSSISTVGHLQGSCYSCTRGRY